MKSELPQLLRRFADEFDTRFRDFLTPGRAAPERLAAAVQYAALAPGKRVRPYLVVRSCELCGGSRESAWPAAAAVECIHAFSLVHDDLPAMDNDDLRRGRPTTHRQFDEALAILAGDALAVLAFEMIARHLTNVEGMAAIVCELAEAAGWAGMIGGQAEDLAGETAPPSIDLARSIHARKTGRIFAAACRIGALSAGADGERCDALATFGERLGAAFQIADDLLDVTAKAGRLGKAVGKDQAAGKQTYPGAIGIAASREAANEAADAASAALAPFGDAADDLRALARYVVERDF